MSCFVLPYNQCTKWRPTNNFPSSTCAQQMMDEANNRANNAEARLSRFKEVETRAKKLEARLESEVRKAEELNDKLAALEQENKVLRQGALSPGVASRSRISRVSGRQLSLENGEELEDGAESPGGELARKREKLVIDHTQLLADQEELLKVRTQHIFQRVPSELRTCDACFTCFGAGFVDAIPCFPKREA